MNGSTIALPYIHVPSMSLHQKVSIATASKADKQLAPPDPALRDLLLHTTEQKVAISERLRDI